MVRAIAAAVLVAATLAMGGCTASEGDVSATCDQQLKRFDNKLFELESRWQNGIEYDRYHELLSDARVQFDQIRARDLDDTCAGQGEKLRVAYNKLIAADSRWQRCINTKMWRCNPNKDQAIVAAWEDGFDRVVKVRESR